MRCSGGTNRSVISVHTLYTDCGFGLSRVINDLTQSKSKIDDHQRIKLTFLSVVSTGCCLDITSRCMMMVSIYCGAPRAITLFRCFLALNPQSAMPTDG